MKVTAFIRKTAAKNNITDQARVYFRVRDIGGVDIKAASELSINPNHWSPERQGYKPRVALVSEEKKMGFDKDVQQITHLITKEYHRGVDGSWLKSLIEEYHHPNINARGGNRADEYLLVVPDTEIHRGDPARGRKPQTPSRQSQQSAALQAFPPRGAAPAGLPSVY